MSQRYCRLRIYEFAYRGFQSAVTVRQTSVTVPVHGRLLHEFKSNWAWSLGIPGRRDRLSSLIGTDEISLYMREI